MHYLLASYLVVAAFFAALFLLVIYSGAPSGNEAFMMAATIATLALIPFGIVLLLKHRH
jgi:hypothetical protein